MAAADRAHFDMDAARQARAEALGYQPICMLGGEQFELPVEAPLEFAYLLQEDTKTAMRYLLDHGRNGDGQFDRFWEHGPSEQDVMALIQRCYGMGLPESSASDGSSKSSGNRSRPTSPASTKSTSAKRVSGRNRSG